MTATSAETGGDMDGPPLCQAQVHNTFEYKLNTRNGEYLIQVSWPLDWNIRGDPGGEESPTIPILYVYVELAPSSRIPVYRNKHKLIEVAMFSTVMHISFRRRM